MIRFNFVVTEEEASKLLEMVSDGAVCARASAAAEGLEPEKRAWYEGAAEFLQGLRQKMDSQREDEVVGDGLTVGEISRTVKGCSLIALRGAFLLAQLDADKDGRPDDAVAYRELVNILHPHTESEVERLKEMVGEGPMEAERLKLTHDQRSTLLVCRTLEQANGAGSRFPSAPEYRALERKGLLRSELGVGIPARGGGSRRRFYWLTEAGRRLAEQLDRIRPAKKRITT